MDILSAVKMEQAFPPVRHFKKNASGRDFVVGDLHGCFTRLRIELETSQFDPSRDRVFAVGDLVDRGFESPAVLDIVRRYDIQSVRGNHEDSIVRWRLCGANDSFIRANGGQWLLNMRGEEKSIDAIVAYMAALPYAIEIETDFGLVGIVHANVPLQSWPRTVEALQKEGINGKIRHKVIWDRSRWKLRGPNGFGPLRRATAQVFKRLKSGRRDACGRVEGVAAVIVGHTPCPEPIVSHNVINVDTGVVYCGNLTLLRLDEIPALLSRATRKAPAFCQVTQYTPARKYGQLR
ncbi:Serine/threonine-protein phosphatase 1 [Paraburkholderia aspalathi]|uniref:metallophosphoesterase n=1 Tax=Paraburkholderia aspalathi TaxID=1324617 RepID=UPI001B2D9380|nr:metallophosphoesterase [Paraburkholderia aspalathi]CAE6837270.1 Serine/threonine-protein phosphatase 1 [Paraburkholderia aspalathi]